MTTACSGVSVGLGQSRCSGRFRAKFDILRFATRGLARSRLRPNGSKRMSAAAFCRASSSIWGKPGRGAVVRRNASEAVLDRSYFLRWWLATSQKTER